MFIIKKSYLHFGLRDLQNFDFKKNLFMYSYCKIFIIFYFRLKLHNFMKTFMKKSLISIRLTITRGSYSVPAGYG